MKTRLTRLVFSLCLLATGPLVLAATSSDDDKAPVDGRLTGWAKPMVVEGGSSALIWLALVGLAIVALAVLFKNARRSHLD